MISSFFFYVIIDFDVTVIRAFLTYKKLKRLIKSIIRDIVRRMLTSIMFRYSLVCLKKNPLSYRIQFETVEHMRYPILDSLLLI